MRIRALSVFEGVVYHCWATDLAQPCKPRLEVEAVLRDGDADRGPLLLSTADYMQMLGGRDAARPCLEELAAQGRIVDHQGVDHIVFAIWTPIDIAPPQSPGPSDP